MLSQMCKHILSELFQTAIFPLTNIPVSNVFGFILKITCNSFIIMPVSDLPLDNLSFTDFILDFLYIFWMVYLFIFLSITDSILISAIPMLCSLASCEQVKLILKFELFCSYFLFWPFPFGIFVLILVIFCYETYSSLIEITSSWCVFVLFLLEKQRNEV